MVTGAVPAYAAQALGVVEWCWVITDYRENPSGRDWPCALGPGSLIVIAMSISPSPDRSNDHTAVSIHSRAATTVSVLESSATPSTSQ
jgi:hypothetical protein